LQGIEITLSTFNQLISGFKSIFDITSILSDDKEKNEEASNVYLNIFKVQMSYSYLLLYIYYHRFNILMFSDYISKFDDKSSYEEFEKIFLKVIKMYPVPNIIELSEDKMIYMAINFITKRLRDDIKQINKNIEILKKDAKNIDAISLVWLNMTLLVLDDLIERYRDIAEFKFKETLKISNKKMKSSKIKDMVENEVQGIIKMCEVYEKMSWDTDIKIKEIT
jgi:hypothetical protein